MQVIDVPVIPLQRPVEVVVAEKSAVAEHARLFDGRVEYLCRDGEGLNSWRTTDEFAVVGFDAVNVLMDVRSVLREL